MPTKKKEESKEITLVDTLFKTDSVTMKPDRIWGIVQRNNTLYIYNTVMEPIQAPVEKGEDGKPIELEVYTQRLAEALYNQALFNKAVQETDQK